MVRKLIAKGWNDPFVRNGAIFFSGSMLVAFLNYLRFPLFSRVLSIESFGEVQALLAVSSVLSIGLGAYTQAAIHAAANDEQADERAAVMRLLRNASLVTLVVLCVLAILTAPLFASALHFSHATPFLLLAVTLTCSALYSMRMGFLQGKGQFGKAFFASALVAGGGLISIFFLSRLGWGATGAMLGIVCGQILGLSFAWYHARHALRAAPDALPYTLSSLQIRQELVHVLILFVVLGCMTMFYTSDIIAVKHYFSPQIAGFYGAISTVANIVMFVTVPLATVMLPQLKRRQEAEKNGQVLRKGLLGVALVGGGAMVCFVLFPHFVVRLLMGAKYLPYAWLLPYQAVAFYMVALANVLVLYGLALRRYRLTIMAFFAMLLLTLLMVFRHESLLQVVQNYLITGVSALCGAVIILKRDLRFHA